MALRTVKTDPEILQSAVIDGINRFIRDVLIPLGVIDQSVLETERGAEFDQRKYAIARDVASLWIEVQIDTEA